MVTLPENANPSGFTCHSFLIPQTVIHSRRIGFLRNSALRAFVQVLVSETNFCQ